MATVSSCGGSTAEESSNPILVDGAACSAPNVWQYKAPGCGIDAHPMCGPSQMEACARDACGCDGKSIGGCEYYAEPFVHFGACAEAGDL